MGFLSLLLVENNNGPRLNTPDKIGWYQASLETMTIALPPGQSPRRYLSANDDASSRSDIHSHLFRSPKFLSIHISKHGSQYIFYQWRRGGAARLGDGKARPSSPY